MGKNMTNILIELRKIRISGVEMGYREFAKSIPATMRELLAERLMDVMLEAKDGSRVPSSLAKTILFYWQREQLSSEAGLTNLLEAVSYADPDRAFTVMESLGIEELKLAFRSTS
jgi:hypothetical protein